MVNEAERIKRLQGVDALDVNAVIGLLACSHGVPPALFGAAAEAAVRLAPQVGREQAVVEVQVVAGRQRQEARRALQDCV